MTARPDTWMPLYVADYLADTVALSCEEHGAYLLLIMDYWRRQGPLPDDDAKLAKIVRLPARRWAVVRETVAEYFQVADGWWHHKRIEGELSKTARQYQRRVDQTKAATEARAQRNDQRNVETTTTTTTTTIS